MTFRAQRIGVATVFAVHGAVTGSWAARIPAISEHLHLSAGTLGIALLMPAIGSIGLMPFTGRAIHRVGGRAATRLLIAFWCAALALPAVAPSLPWLCATLVIFGAAAGTSDIAMNAQGSSLEQRMGKSIMSGLHGMWSVGGFVAAGIAALAARGHVGAPVHLALMALALFVVGQLGCALLARPAVAETNAAPQGENNAAPQGGTNAARPRFGFPPGIVLLIGLVAFCAVFGEVAGADWCAVYMRRVLHSASATAAAAYTVFAFTMSVARLTGDRVVRWFGEVATVRASAVAGAAGAALVMAAVSELTTMVGFGLMGLGVAVVVPLAFAAAGRIGSAQGGEAGAGHAIAGVATIAYGAGLAAPAAIGGIATLTSLPISFGFVAGLIAVVSVTAQVLRPRTASVSGSDRATVAA
jgi:MFS family permease